MAETNEVELADALHKAYNDLKDEIGKKIVGQDDTIDQLLIAIFSQGHALLIGVPGLAKTLLIQTLSEVLDLDFNRIQFTPDLMPADITGLTIYNKSENPFQFKEGPLFNQLILADDINRTSPKPQSIFLQSIKEGQVPVDHVTYDLQTPFLY